ncbi:alpha/beta fold hydrolase [Sorangium sp. So ce834]|uniref:thioesterase II family protein n=1 Tax=Sorangium sp. So ce834 TaxID=3133321 RepID=UPI003F62738F
MSDRGRWLLRSAPSAKPRARLLCLPHAGAGASLFRLWPERAPDAVEVVRAQLPGREERAREPPSLSMTEVVAAIERELGDGPPTAIFGHSLGGLIAFELAKRLHEAGATPARLFVSGARPPHLPDPHQLHRLPEPDFIEALRRRGGIPDDVLRHAELRDMVGRLLRADLALAETWHRPEPVALPVPITVCAARADAVVSWEATGHWSLCSTRGYERVELPGDHFFIKQHDALVMAAVFPRILQATAAR